MSNATHKLTPKLTPALLVLLTALLLLGCGSTSKRSQKLAASVERGEAVHPIPMFPATGQEGAHDQTAIVRVGQARITKADFAHVDELLTPRRASYEPKNRVDCSSTRAASEVKLPKGGPKLSPAQVKALCIRQKQQIVREGALRQLISYYWVTGEAKELGLDPSEAEVRKALAQSVAQQFKHKREYTRFLQNTGETVPDLLLEVRQELDNQRIHELIERKSQTQPQPTHAEIVRYYRVHKSSLQGKSLRQAEGLVRAKLAEEALNREKAAFIRQFREKWLARTSCSPGYVSPYCREWKGPSLLVTADPYGVG